MILNWFHKGKENSIHIYVTFSLVIYGNLDGVYVSKGMTCISVYKDVLFASHTIACSISPGHIYLFSIHYVHLSFHIPNLIFSTHSHSFPHHPHPLVHFFMTFMCFLVENERKNIFFYHFGFALQSPSCVYKHLVRICVIESAHKSNTNVLLWGSFSFFDNSNCVYIIYNFNFHFFFFFFLSSQPTFLSHFALRVFFWEVYKKNQQIHLQGEEEKWWKTCDSLVC